MARIGPFVDKFAPIRLTVPFLETTVLEIPVDNETQSINIRAAGDAFHS